MDYKFTMNLHDWQKTGFTTVLKKCNNIETHNIIPVNACVGSGKTFFSSLGMADFIDLHKNEKTIQIFVTPRIKLCAQQKNEFIEMISNCGPFSYQKFEEFPGNGSPFQLIPVDCTHKEWNRSNTNLNVQHAIFIICDASLWGEDKAHPGKRWNSWLSRFKAWKKAGYVFGNCVFDEAHNFRNTDKIKKMFGTKTFKKNEKINYENCDCLLSYFQNVILLSGTPADYQKDITRAYPENVCECPLNVAIKNKWVEYPILNLVKIYSDDLFSTGVIKVLEHERDYVKPAHGVRLLVNFGSIPEIDEFENDNYIINHMGKDFHFITIHSPVNFKNDDLTFRECKSMVNGKTYSSDDVYDLLEGLDSGKTSNKKMQSVLNEVLDGKPIMVGQVQMIGEGINIKSFNSVITKSNSDTTAMQQIGRILRKYNGKEFPNVYCVYDNAAGLKYLLANLWHEHSLTADCFEWGKKIELTGKGYATNDDENDNELKERSNIGWFAIDENLDPDIAEIQYSDEFRDVKLGKNMKDITVSDDYENLKKLISTSFSMSKLQMIVKTFKRSNKATGAKKGVKKHKISKKKNLENEQTIVTSPDVNERNISMVTNINQVNDTTNEDMREKSGKLINEIEEAIFEMVIDLRNSVLRAHQDERMMECIKNHPEYLIECQLSYAPELVKILIDSNIHTNKSFLKLIELD